MMETYKLIRKICLWLTVIGLVIALMFGLYESRNDYSPYDFVPFALFMCFSIYLGVYILFAIISKLIEAVKKDTGKMKVFSDKQYLEAYSEVEENNIQNKELWAKAFAQCGGDKEKQKSIYVELRTKELSKG